jgi:ArsR family transcriptional regulator
MPQIVTLFKALADSNRLRIVNILSQRELCVCDIQSVLGLSQPFVSRHLAYLRRSGLVRDRRDGARVYYSLAQDDAVGLALGPLLRAATQNSAAFQSDLRTLYILASAGELKPGTMEAAQEPYDARAA